MIEAADKERRRVGRDLHDGAQQRLLAVSNLLRVSRMKLDEDDPAHDLVARAEEELAQAHAELRKLARGLHPVALRERGLGQALASLCQASDVPIEVDVYEGELPLPLARGAYFVAAESLANAARYAQASKIDVRIAKEEETLVVEVSDDGVGGADIEKRHRAARPGDRVDVLGGRLAVDSPAGGGTRIRATIPLPPHDRPPPLHRLRRGERAARRGPVRPARRLRARPAGDGAEGVRGAARAARAPRHARARRGSRRRRSRTSSASARRSIASPARWRGA